MLNYVRRGRGEPLVLVHGIGGRRARHVWLRGCGHVPTWDDPQLVATLPPAGSSDA